MIGRPEADLPIFLQTVRVKLEAFYNRRRLPSSLGYVSPEGYENLVTKEVVAVA